MTTKKKTVKKAAKKTVKKSVKAKSSKPNKAKKATGKKKKKAKPLGWVIQYRKKGDHAWLALFENNGVPVVYEDDEGKPGSGEAYAERILVDHAYMYCYLDFECRIVRSDNQEAVSGPKPDQRVWLVERATGEDVCDWKPYSYAHNDEAEAREQADLLTRNRFGILTCRYRAVAYVAKAG